MKFVPHDYQSYAIEYIKNHPVSAILLDCGLGKTVITLTAIYDLMYDSFEVKKVLIVAPLRVARDTWTAELEKWEHLKGLTCSVVVGTEAERRAALRRKADIYTVNRENVPWLINNTPFDYDMVVVDELSSFKNHKAKRFQALMRMRPKVKRIVGLTGTPAANGLMDLWAEFKLLDMGKRLGRFISHYREEFFLPDKRNGPVIYSYKPRAGAEDEIYSRISDIAISMRAADHLKLPELISNEYVVRLDESERAKYDELRRNLVLSLPSGELTATNAAALSGKLSQMANGAVYDDDGNCVCVHSRKLEALEDIIESAGGKPLMIAYWFKHDLQQIEALLLENHIAYVQISTEDSIKKWNSGEAPVALIHPAAAGHGLNLQFGGSTLVWFGLTWSLELYQQTNARLHRQGQSSDTVVLIHLITEDTIDRQILAALTAKDKTQTALINAVKANLKQGGIA